MNHSQIVSFIWGVADLIRDTFKRGTVTAVPPKNEKKDIVQQVLEETRKIDALIAKIREGIEKLKEYRIALISGAVTGKIDVREDVVT
ncbi:MAG TPA: hypothetical protein VLJ79_14370 [Candidatus Binatia bacterium]|nr:hypothetical protein [Candidatus Binatia bacterium]